MKNVSIIRIFFIFICCMTLLSSCSKRKDENTDENTVRDFLINIYTADEKDVQMYEKFVTSDVASETNNSSGIIDISESEDFKEYTSYLRDKFKVTEELFDELMANRYSTRIAQLAYDEGELYKPENITITYVDSMKLYDYELDLNGKTLKGSVRLEEGMVVWCELGF